MVATSTIVSYIKSLSFGAKRQTNVNMYACASDDPFMPKSIYLVIIGSPPVYDAKMVRAFLIKKPKSVHSLTRSSTIFVHNSVKLAVVRQDITTWDSQTS